MDSTTVNNGIQELLDNAYTLRINNIQKSIDLANKALTIGKNTNEVHTTAKSLTLLSLFHMIIGDFDLSINMALEAIDHFEKLGDELGVADAKYNIAGALYKRDGYTEGLDYLKDCLLTYKRYNDHHNISRVQKSMGTIYEYFGDINSAIRSYEDAIKSGEMAKDKNLQSNAFNPLSGIYLNNGDVEQALALIEKSIAWKSESNDTRGLAFALYGRGKVFIKTGDFKLAEQDFQDSIEIHERMGDKLGIAMAWHKLGALYIEMERLDDAKEVLTQTLKYCNKYRVMLIKFKTNLLLHKVAKLEKDYELALKYMTQYIQEKESAFNNNASRMIENYEVITKMQSLEQEAEAQKEKAEVIEKKNIELDSFFYRISHDLKGPITAIGSLNYLAKCDVEDEQALKYFDDINAQATRMNNILDSLMKLTKLSYSSDTKQEIDFERLTYDCIDSYKHLPNFDKVQFNIDIASNIYFTAEWALINTIIQNLIENSIKYARNDESNPKIDIKIESDTSEIKIIVSDNGIGMSEETQSKIFKMFFRVNRTIEGTGLGLHILNRAVEKLNGKIKIESQLEVGSKFIVSLPINQR